MKFFGVSTLNPELYTVQKGRLRIFNASWSLFRVSPQKRYYLGGCFEGLFVLLCFLGGGLGLLLVREIGRSL